MFAHFEALEADFQREYGLDMREVLWGENFYGVRRLLALIRGLSARGTFRTNITSRGQDWGSIEELLSAVIEQLDLSNRLFVAANSKKGTKPWKPLVVPRPTIKPRGPSSHDEVRAFFARGPGKVKKT